jgi:hypothetical protein
MASNRIAAEKSIRLTLTQMFTTSNPLIFFLPFFCKIPFGTVFNFSHSWLTVTNVNICFSKIYENRTTKKLKAISTYSSSFRYNECKWKNWKIYIVNSCQENRSKAKFVHFSFWYWHRHQGDQIGRIFAYWVVVYFAYFLTGLQQRKLLTTLSQCTSYVFSLTKKWVGLHFGPLVHKLIWSRWSAPKSM